MLEKCPWWLKKNENVQAFYKAVAKLFDEIDNIYNLLEKQHLIDYANKEFLDYLGIKFNVERKNQTDNRYRNRIKLAMLKSNLVPNIDAISNIGQMFTGIVHKPVLIT
jgi:predicted ATP-binding protein involved in virulence